MRDIEDRDASRESALKKAVSSLKDDEGDASSTGTVTGSLLPSLRSSVHNKQKSNQRVLIDSTKSLHQVLGEIHITNIKKVFFKQEEKKLAPHELRKALMDHAKIEFADDSYFDLIFQRMNIKNDGYVSWDEFISHLILGYKIQDVDKETKSLDLPISKKPRLVKSNHRHPINSIVFNFQVKADRSCGYHDGSYMTLSHDGIINYWSLDMRVERSEHARTALLTLSDTWVLCMASMPDVSVVAVGSTERDIRFYDTSARKFELRVQVYALEHAVYSMTYTFPKDPNEDCKLILGDMGGNVTVLMFSPINRGPFRSKMGVPLLTVPYERMEKGLVPGFKLVIFRNLHKEWVRQVEYYSMMNMIVSGSTSNRALVMRDINETRGFYAYYVPKGIWCFACADGFPMLATGGSDCLVRVWNPYVTKRPLVVFYGHHTGILAIVIQDKGEVLASLSEDKCIKIWDVPAQTCMQTYLGLGNELGEYAQLTMFYNPTSRQIVIGGVAIAILPFRPLPNGEHTDGNSHAAAISVILYNPLFQVIITCGLDSNIIVWDPWGGHRLSVVREAHTRQLHGEIIPVDITAGCFDPAYQLLLTGAYDGTLKTWNFNTGTCLRNMRIEHSCEVTGVCWVKGRILAVGWNRHVTEFADSSEVSDPGGAFAKMWSIKHTDDVLCAAARVPQTLATSTYNGELVLWRLETGQPYKQYTVSNPTLRIKITYDFEKRSRHQKPKVTPYSLKYGLKKDLKKAPPPVKPTPSHIIQKLKLEHTMETEPISIAKQLNLRRKAKPLTLPPTICPIRGLAVRCMIFLNSRPMKPEVGTLLVALENGDVQLWSHHASGGFLGAFQAVHSVGDYVLSMATDENNKYLVTGSTEGYIKVFLLTNYYTGEPDKHISMPRLRLRFPFLWHRFFPGRAMRALGGQTKPLLVNSFKAHRQIVSGLIYIDKPKIVVSSSADYSARMWTLGGQYLGTLGTFKPWVRVDPDKPLDINDPNVKEYKIPPDVKRVMSSTTHRVLLASRWHKKLSKKQEAAQAEKDNVYKTKKLSTYGRKLQTPILGHFVKLPVKTTQKFEVHLDTIFPYIPVYQHLIRPPPVPLPTLTPHTNLEVPNQDLI